MDRESKTLSIIIPAYNEGNAIVSLLEHLDVVLQKISLQTKIIVVDDGSTDNTLEKINLIRSKTPITILCLSRNFGKEAAMSAGLAVVDTDAVIIMDADGQHSPNYIPDFINLWDQGYDMVSARRVSRETDSWSRRFLSRVYYKLIAQGTSCVESGLGDFRLLSANVVEAINSLPERGRFMKGLFNWVGFKKCTFDYVPQARLKGESKFSSFASLFRFGILGFISFSVLPLRIITSFGLFRAALSMAYGFFIFIRTILYGIDIPGWATLSVGFTFLGSVQLISLGVIGEYVGQILSEVKNRPLYIVSKVMEVSSNDQ